MRLHLPICRYIGLLNASGVDKIVLLTHRGYALDMAMAEV